MHTAPFFCLFPIFNFFTSKLVFSVDYFPDMQRVSPTLPGFATKALPRSTIWGARLCGNGKWPIATKHKKKRYQSK